MNIQMMFAAKKIYHFVSPSIRARLRLKQYQKPKLKTVKTITFHSFDGWYVQYAASMSCLICKSKDYVC
jgi:hypothetical protein